MDDGALGPAEAYVTDRRAIAVHELEHNLSEFDVRRAQGNIADRSRRCAEGSGPLSNEDVYLRPPVRRVLRQQRCSGRSNEPEFDARHAVWLVWGAILFDDVRL